MTVGGLWTLIRRATIAAQCSLTSPRKILMCPRGWSHLLKSFENGCIKVWCTSAESLARKTWSLRIRWQREVAFGWPAVPATSACIRKVIVCNASGNACSSMIDAWRNGSESDIVSCITSLCSLSLILPESGMTKFVLAGHSTLTGWCVEQMWCKQLAHLGFWGRLLGDCWFAQVILHNHWKLEGPQNAKLLLGKPWKMRAMCCYCLHCCGHHLPLWTKKVSKSSWVMIIQHNDTRDKPRAWSSERRRLLPCVTLQ